MGTQTWKQLSPSPVSAVAGTGTGLCKCRQGDLSFSPGKRRAPGERGAAADPREACAVEGTAGGPRLPVSSESPEVEGGRKRQKREPSGEAGELTQRGGTGGRNRKGQTCRKPTFREAELAQKDIPHCPHLHRPSSRWVSRHSHCTCAHTPKPAGAHSAITPSLRRRPGLKRAQGQELPASVQPPIQQKQSPLAEPSHTIPANSPSHTVRNWGKRAAGEIQSKTASSSSKPISNKRQTGGRKKRRWPAGPAPGLLRQSPEKGELHEEATRAPRLSDLLQNPFTGP